MTIREYMELHRQDMEDDLKRLVMIPSERGDACPGAPFGSEVRRALEETRRMYEALGLSSTISGEGGWMKTIRPGTSKRTIGIFSHADVVPGGSDWILTDNAYHPVVKEGFLIGRGASDNKAAIAVSLQMLRAIRDLSLPIHSSLLFYTGGNEESGMADILHFMKTEPQPEISLVPDGNYPVTRGEKGVLRFWAVSPEIGEIEELDGGSAFNIVLGKIKAKMNGVSYEGTGIPRHAALPEGSLNAAYQLLPVLAEKAENERTKEILSCAAAMLAGYYGDAFGIASVDPSFGPLTCVNGMVRFDGRIRLAFDLRFGTTTVLEELTDTIRSYLAAIGWDMEPVRGAAAFEMPSDHPLVTEALSLWKTYTGEMQPQSRLNPGGTYARYLKNVVSTGNAMPVPLPYELPVGHGGVHQPDEGVSLDGLVRGAAFLTELVLRYDTISF